MGCVYEEPTKAPGRGFVLSPPTPWRSIVDNTTIPPSVCPLYLGHVAEASDIRDALPFYRRGADYLRAWLGHEPSRDLLEALEAHEDGVAYWRGDPNGGSKAGA